MISLLALFGAVLVLNVLPAFAPPTWMLLSFFGVRFPDASPWMVALVAASAATCGRCVLAAFAQRWTRSRWIPPNVRDNLRSVALTIGHRRAASSGVKAGGGASRTVACSTPSSWLTCAPASKPARSNSPNSVTNALGSRTPKNVVNSTMSAKSSIPCP